MSVAMSFPELDQSKFSLDSISDLRKQLSNPVVGGSANAAEGETIDPYLDDFTLARFLVARNGKVEDAANMLRAYLSWRSDYCPVLKETILTEASRGALYWRGYDKLGHPLIHWNIKFQNPKQRDLDELVRCAVWFTEVALSHLPPEKSKISVLVNRIGAKGEHSDLSFDKQVIKLFADNYPERLHTLVVYPAGILLYSIWNILKFFVDPVTQAKVKIVLSLKGVQEYIDDEYIPRDMGGLDDYAFSLDNFSDPYPADMIESSKGKDYKHIQISEEEALQDSIRLQDVLDKEDSPPAEELSEAVSTAETPVADGSDK